MYNRVIVIYTIIYDSDPNQVYYFTDFKKVLASIESSLYGYIMDDNNDQAVSAINKCLTVVKTLADAPIIPIIFESLQIMINRWTIDSSCEIHKVLLECLDKIDDEIIRDKISNLFSVQ
jgi:hypothetical protein